MTALHDDPLFLAMIEGQSRAQCEYQQSVQLKYARLREIFNDAAQYYARGSFDGSMKRILSFVINWHEPYTDDAERYGYKCACGLEFHRRKMTDIEFQAELDKKRPFVPTKVYEQDM